MDAARLLVWLGLFFVAAHSQTGEPQSTHHAGGVRRNGGVGCRGWGGVGEQYHLDGHFGLVGLGHLRTELFNC